MWENGEPTFQVGTRVESQGRKWVNTAISTILKSLGPSWCSAVVERGAKVAEKKQFRSNPTLPK